MFVFLSHPLNMVDGAWPGEPTLTVEKDSVIGQSGKPFNSVMMHLPNHFGTHIDGPKHFNPEGADFDTLPADKFGFFEDEILLVDLPEKNVPESLITKEDLEPYAEQLKNARILLIRTGFEKNKKDNPDLYINHGPAIHSEFARWLNEEFPKLDVIGMDWLSIASPANDHGPEAHRWLLGNYTGHIITGIEDMPLAVIGDKKIKFLTLGPLRVEGVDSVPISPMAWLED
ncbi:cyclase family protein [Arcanobacterium haemolyticum]|nr:cyclase family protein [Arcanobacterium haemolyticum]